KRIGSGRKKPGFTGISSSPSISTRCGKSSGMKSRASRLRASHAVDSLRSGGECDADPRLVALVRLHVVLHPAGEEHEQSGARLQMNVRVPVGDGSLDAAMNHSRAGIAEAERAGARRHLEIEAAREERALVQMQEIEAAAVMQVHPRLQLERLAAATHLTERRRARRVYGLPQGAPDRPLE